MAYVLGLLLGVAYGLLLESVGVTIHQNTGKFLLFVLIPILFAGIVAAKVIFDMVAVVAKEDKEEVE